MSNGQNNNNKGCNLHQFQRNNYFYGKLMTVRDFEDEQSYLNEKRHLLNRLIHSSGIVCGFELEDPLSSPDDEVEIKFSKGGVVIDCCGHEIVIPDGTLKKVINEKTGSTLTANQVISSLYLYLKYKPCFGEMVNAASNPSSCEETCCPGRIIEDFEVVASETKPSTIQIQCPDLSAATDSDEAMKKMREWTEKAIESCPACEDARVFLAAIKTDLTIDKAETGKYRLFIYNNKLLSELITCHVSDFTNPHKIEAQDVGAFVSIDGVSNPGGNVDLKQDNSIIITPDDLANTISIGENHSSRNDNPHDVSAAQAGALVSINNVKNPGGDVKLVAGNNINIKTDAAAKSITIDSTAGVDPAEKVTSVSTTSSVGNSIRYARENHVHDLEDHVVEFKNLAKTLQDQLGIVFMYLRERALKCTVINFDEVGKKFDNKTAFELSEFSKAAVNEKVYQTEERFFEAMRKVFEMQEQIAEEIERLATKESWEGFVGALEDLKKVLESKESLKIATAQDEVCFYALQLERPIG